MRGDHMKIERIKKVGASKYQLILQNKDVITTYEDVILKHNLLYHKEIDEDLLPQLLKETKHSDIYYQSVKKLTSKFMSEKEYRKWLKKFELKKEEEVACVSRVKDVGLLNDQAYACAYVRDKARLSKYGKEKIEQDLKDQGIGEEVRKHALQEIDEIWMYEKLEHAILKKISQNHRYSNRQLKQKIISEFMSLGFLKADILEVLSHVKWEEETKLLEREYEKILVRAKRKYQGNELVKYVKNKLYQKGFSLEQIEACMERKNNDF